MFNNRHVFAAWTRRAEALAPLENDGSTTIDEEQITLRWLEEVDGELRDDKSPAVVRELKQIAYASIEVNGTFLPYCAEVRLRGD